MIILLQALIADQLIQILLVVVKKDIEGDLALEVGLIRGLLVVRVAINKDGCLPIGSKVDREVEVTLVEVLIQSICLMK